LEKLLYSLWPAVGSAADDFRDTLVGRVGPELAGLDAVHGVRVTVADSGVAAANHRRLINSPRAPAAVLSLWVDDAGAAGRWEPLLDQHCDARAAYLVAEAEPLISQRNYPSLAGERVHGMCTVVFMRKPRGLTRAQWLAAWKDRHTGIAIETQATFGYRQNLVVRAFGQDPPACDAIVEENFPPAAMASDHAFYDTGGDEALLQQRMAAMMESCARFIDFTLIDVVPMSEYVIAHREA
jgi:hypothetical protein